MLPNRDKAVTCGNEMLTHRRRRLHLPGGDDLHAHSRAQQADLDPICSAGNM